MRGRPEERESTYSPGPGEYEPLSTQSKERVIGHTISKTKRSDLVTKEEYSKPGPGNYDSAHKQMGKDAKSVRINLFSIKISSQLVGSTKTNREMTAQVQEHMNLLMLRLKRMCALLK